jgi:hypothetical protein
MLVRSGVAVATCAALCACTTVEAHYEAPAKTADEIANQAKRQLTFVALQSLRLHVEPKAAAQKDTPPLAGVTSAPPASPQTSPPATHHEGAALGTGRSGGGGAGSGTRSGTGGASPPTTPQTDDKPAQSVAGGAGGTPLGNTGGSADAKDQAKADGTDQPSGVVTNATIAGKEYDGTLAALEDTTHGIMVSGHSGFWKKTILTAARYADSDRVQSLTVKAESLVVTRIGELATVAGHFISPTKAANEAGLIKRPDLPAFDIDLAHIENGKTADVPDVPGWSYRLSWTVPDGTVTWADFNRLAVGQGKAVNYFPAPACLIMSVELSTIYNGNTETYRFKPFLGSTPDVVRLEPLPVDGKLSLSPVCSSSVTGTMNSDPYEEAFQAAAALDKAYGDLKDGAKSSTTTKSTTSKPAGQ